MPKNQTTEKKRAREVQAALGIPYTDALKRLQAAKTDGTSWSEAADQVIQEGAK